MADFAGRVGIVSLQQMLASIRVGPAVCQAIKHPVQHLHQLMDSMMHNQSRQSRCLPSLVTEPDQQLSAACFSWVGRPCTLLQPLELPSDPLQMVCHFTCSPIGFVLHVGCCGMSNVFIPVESCSSDIMLSL